MSLELLRAIPFTIAALFPVLNPLGSAVIFLTITYGVSQQELNLAALKVAINTVILLVIVLLTGSYILQLFGITIPIVQVGGGMVIAYIGWTLLNQSSAGNSAAKDVPQTDKNISDLTFFPLTMPITAGPGCIAITLTIGAHQISPKFADTIMGEVGTIIGIIISAIIVYICYRYAKPITQMFGNSGSKVIMRLSAFINLCIGLQIIWNGIQGLLPLQ